MWNQTPRKQKLVILSQDKVNQQGRKQRILPHKNGTQRMFQTSNTDRSYEKWLGGRNKSFEEEMFHRTWSCSSLFQFSQYDGASEGEEPYYESGVSRFISFAPCAPQNNAYPHVILHNFQGTVFDLSKWQLL